MSNVGAVTNMGATGAKRAELVKDFLYIFPTTGHAGSTYLCKLMLRAGIKCGHEDVYQAIRENISLVRNPPLVALQRGYQAESSIFSVPYLRTKFLRAAQCVHIVRQPWMIVRSWQRSLGGIGISTFFKTWIDIYEAWPFDIKLFGNNERSSDWLAGICVSWNNIIRKLRPESPMCKIQDTQRLLDICGIDYKGEWPSHRTNSKVDHSQPYSLEIQDDGIWEAFCEWTTTAGYGIPSRSGEIKETSEDECSASRSDS